MNRDQKAAVIEEVTTQIKAAEAIFAVDYRGLSVKEAADLRTKLGEAGVSFRVVKNSLTERAVDAAGVEGLRDLLEGPTAFAFVPAEGGDAATAAKVLAQFRRETDTLAFKGGTMNGAALTIEQVEAISKLPSLEVLHGQLVGVIAAPLNGLVRGLGSMISGLAVALGQVQEQGLIGQSAADEALAEETPSEAPGDPVAEGEAAEAETDSENDESEQE